MPQSLTIRREATLEVIRATPDAPPTVRMSVSSEAPVLTRAKVNGVERDIYEVLGHSPEEIDLSRVADGMPICDRHGGDQVGLIRSPKVEGARVSGEVEWCAGQRAADIAADCANGIRRGASVDGAGFANSYKLVGEQNGVPVFRVTRWQPVAAALVPVPADWSVGVERAAKHPETIPDIVINQQRTTTMPETTQTPAAAQPQQSDFVRMLTLAKTHDIPIAMLDEHVGRGGTLDDWRDKVIAEVARGHKARPVGAAEPDVPKKDMRRYNLTNVLRTLTGQGSPDITFEREVSAAIAKATNREPSGIFFPTQFARESLPAGIMRAESGVVANASTIETETGMMLDILRPKLLQGVLNYQVMGGLNGNVSLPKDSAAAGYYWVAESAAVSQQLLSAGQVALTPHTIGVYADVSKQLLAQSSFDAQAWISGKLLRNLAQGMDAALIQGSGNDGQPKGIINATGVNTPSIGTGGTPTYAELLGFLDAIEDDNADAEAMRWLLRPNARSKMAVTDLSTGAGLPFLNLTAKTAGGYGFAVSNVGPANSALFGDFSRAILGMWGAIDLNIDRASLSTTGGTRIVALALCDVAVTYGEAFAYSARVAA